MFTLAFLKATLERAVKTFGQSLAALLVAGGTGILDTNWGDRFSVAGMAAVVSVLTSVGSSQIGEDGPSLGGEVLEPTLPPPVSDGRLRQITAAEDIELSDLPESYSGDSKGDAAYHAPPTQPGWVDEREGGDTP